MTRLPTNTAVKYCDEGYEGVRAARGRLKRGKKGETELEEYTTRNERMRKQSVLDWNETMTEYRN